MALFEVVVDSAFVGTRKPEPEIYALLLRRLGLPGPAVIYIDDMPEFLAAAAGFGIHGIWHQGDATATRRPRP